MEIIIDVDINVSIFEIICSISMLGKVFLSKVRAFCSIINHEFFSSDDLTLIAAIAIIVATQLFSVSLLSKLISLI